MPRVELPLAVLQGLPIGPPPPGEEEDDENAEAEAEGEPASTLPRAKRAACGPKDAGLASSPLPLPSGLPPCMPRPFERMVPSPPAGGT